ncbi:TIGR04283 family arsenosugar biosynthesis glycosyltransferase [Anabaena cylindrica FACHB-243]|uniref:4,4'-diaponeurosporenoate glycosyltransferase n=1 Tax=Anabaena cylindrica (strain ATCC 27899 / PCC 7122) TaxID=272123 RepID=K9ZM30_ANACC|nr:MULTISPECIES: TIGR04283 family arsenosugar biosynthesis glycosyltransferase [Anabaena]AFZ60293.1 glycosyl transferase family 2 [Anabaena cylindrica PCC 7122]MBD2417655.1 TIGR04283 family arsenosugar biosynthesis glycosyltransferase [Anabaena cylindrica FACHB-243]MBY5282048.1 glycosyltransferase family 2 protein [Anabaena sp. CCAP 1446/1C]MBY5308886.1 glycosyltransferase family 2 protein [Anabaena sp. CCAP 1446/1C]MCM2404570.1 TIGR04283 family arsenosugar biosynthesis glycosyltransferase [An
MIQNLDHPRISIIIPTLNEAENIKNAIASTQPSTNIEIIIVDGGSQDSTTAIAQSLGATIVSSQPGRAIQMNAGAAVATGEILLFLHADTLLPPGFDDMIRTTLQQPGIIAGAFALRIDAPHWGLRLVEWGVEVRSRFWQMPYGDQAIFLTQVAFAKIGNFLELPIMEDFELIRRLKNQGKISLISIPVITSSRRWLKKGIFITTFLNQIIIFAYLLGISPERIRKLYRWEKFKRI